MSYLIDIINTDNEPNSINNIMSEPIKINSGEWLFKGCFIQEFKHPKLSGRFEVFKNDKQQTHISVCNNFEQAKKLCIENECFDNYLNF
jgi:hypothetical protein